MPEIFRYGDFPSNYTEIYPARGDVLRGTVALLHGGWWRARFDVHLMDALCESLADDGWRVGNVEFRRTQGEPGDVGGWPQTFDDVLSALNRKAAVPAGLPTVAIGHSAGGHLALLAAAAGLVDAAVGIAPITDLARCEAEGLGESATSLFIGSSLDADPELYAEASPFERLPLGRPQLIVHGTDDARVPIAHSQDYVARAQARGDSIELAEFEGTDHFQVIDPAHPSWVHVRNWISAL